jgi:hypothetical protein
MINDLQLTGRANGKTAALAKKAAEHREPGEHWLSEPTEQDMARIAASKAKTRGEQRRLKRQTRLACPHAIVRHRQVPHPRYGKSVAHFVSWTEPLTDAHDCVTGRFR